MTGKISNIRLRLTYGSRKHINIPWSACVNSAKHPYVNVIRYTTFFHQFTLMFDELKREKYVDWYGYSASVSPYILEQFEKEMGYKFRPEYIIDQGYYNNQYRVPGKEYKDFQAFQRREVAKLAKEMVDITHECGKEAMMFLGGSLDRNRTVYGRVCYNWT